MKQPFYIPLEGGKSEVFFTCYRQKYVNGEQADIYPSALKGLRYNISRTNSSLIHSINIEKDGASAGKYKFIIESSGAYNLTNWGVKISFTTYSVEAFYTDKRLESYKNQVISYFLISCIPLLCFFNDKIMQD